MSLSQLEEQRKPLDRQKKLRLSIHKCPETRDNLDPEKVTGKRADIRVNIGSEEEKYLTWSNCKRQERPAPGKHLGLFALCDWSLAISHPKILSSGLSLPVTDHICTWESESEMLRSGYENLIVRVDGSSQEAILRLCQFSLTIYHAVE